MGSSGVAMWNRAGLLTQRPVRAGPQGLERCSLVASRAVPAWPPSRP